MPTCDATLLPAAQITLSMTGPSHMHRLGKPGLFILEHGWALATTRQYAAAVNKLFSFLRSNGQDPTSHQPFRAKVIYNFILWCAASENKAVLSSTIKRYLTGLRMWHVLHNNPFPEINSNRIRLLLKSCKKIEVYVPKKVRTGLNLRDLLALSDRLTSANTLDLVTKAVLLVGFWGLARLGELTLHRDHPLIFVRRRDLRFSTDGNHAVIKLRLAKTASPGEVQFLRLTAQPNRLDPINVLHELVNVLPGKPDDPLFPGRMRAIPISRHYISNFLKANGPQDHSQWSGHSLRIGGASFQAHAGRSVASLKKLGRWKSSAYKRYISAYSPKLSMETKALSRFLHY